MSRRADSARRKGAAAAILTMLVFLAMAGLALATLFPREFRQVGEWVQRMFDALVK